MRIYIIRESQLTKNVTHSGSSYSIIFHPTTIAGTQYCYLCLLSRVTEIEAIVAVKLLFYFSIPFLF